MCWLLPFFKKFDGLREERSVNLTSQELRVLKILEANLLKITDREVSFQISFVTTVKRSGFYFSKESSILPWLNEFGY